ncbi:MAG: SDR family oxidoreductase [Vampirovibrionales bacterium]|nr:SDR family oxidoreductase [Vampirovibrionales bacterium]
MPSGALAGKSALVTGASTGIGRDCALTLARVGMTTYAGVRRAEDAQALQAQAEGDLRPISLDVTDPASITAARERLQADQGPRGLDALINNAGFCLVGPLETTSMTALLNQFQVNAIGPIAVTQAFLPMLRTARGRVVMMSSISGLFSSPFVGPYAGSKFALEALSDSLRMELLAQGVTVSVLQPGPIRTPLWQKTTSEAASAFPQVPQEIQQLYAPLFLKMGERAARSGQTGDDPSVVTRVILRALTDRSPKSRYGVGRGGFLWRTMRALPDRWRDAMILYALRH